MSLAIARLASLPWEQLPTIADALAAPIADMLDGQPAERTVDGLLRRNRQWANPQRQLAAELIFGVGLWRRRLCARLGLSRPSPQQLMECLRDEALGRFDAPPSDFADRQSLPDWLAQLVLTELGDEAEAFADAINAPGPIFIRANTARITRDALSVRLRAEGVSTQQGSAHSCLRITSPRPNLFGLPAWRDGLFEVQDDGSQRLGELVEPKAGDEVLDLCAGAGGKTLQLCAGLAGQGRVHAFDTDGERLERLRRRAERARCADSLVIHHGQLPQDLRVDRVLVDAPCSELGPLRRGPDVRWRLQPERFGALPALQLELLEQALGCLKPLGTLVYATCTIRSEENEQVAAELERRHPTLQRTATLKLSPHQHDTDGFFAARWQKP